VSTICRHSSRVVAFLQAVAVVGHCKLLYIVPFASYLTLNNMVTLKYRSWVTQGH